MLLKPFGHQGPDSVSIMDKNLASVKIGNQDVIIANACLMATPTVNLSSVQNVHQVPKVSKEMDNVAHLVTESVQFLVIRITELLMGVSLTFKVPVNTF